MCADMPASHGRLWQPACHDCAEMGLPAQEDQDAERASQRPMLSPLLFLLAPPSHDTPLALGSPHPLAIPGQRGGW